jgi:hypothetical protein
MVFRGLERKRGNSSTTAHFPLILSIEGSLVYTIGSAAQFGKFSWQNRLDLMIRGLANPDRSKQFSEKLFREVRDREKYRAFEAEKIDGFAYLLNRLQEDEPAANKIAAAELLVLFAPFSTEQRTSLDRLRRQEKLSEQVRHEIDKVLNSR